MAEKVAPVYSPWYCHAHMYKRVKAKWENLVVQSNSLDLSLWVIFDQLLMQVVYFDALLCPVCEWGTYFHFTTAIKESPKQRPHTGSHRNFLSGGPGAHSKVQISWKVYYLLETVISPLFFFQPKQPLWAHAHLQMYACVFLWLTWVWEYSKVQILWSNAIAVLVACASALCVHITK